MTLLTSIYQCNPSHPGDQTLSVIACTVDNNMNATCPYLLGSSPPSLSYDSSCPPLMFLIFIFSFHFTLSPCKPKPGPLPLRRLTMTRTHAISIVLSTTSVKNGKSMNFWSLTSTINPVAIQPKFLWTAVLSAYQLMATPLNIPPVRPLQRSEHMIKSESLVPKWNRSSLMTSNHLKILLTLTFMKSPLLLEFALLLVVVHKYAPLYDVVQHQCY